MSATALTALTPGVGRQRASLANLGVFTRFTLRRNWVRFLVWFLVIVGMLAFIVDYYQTLFVTQTALDDFVNTVNQPSLMFMVGIISNPISIGGATWCKAWMFLSMMLGIGVVFLMTRNLRGDEDEGRAELVRSYPLGIHSRLAASVVLMSALSIVVAVFSGLVLAAMSPLTVGGQPILNAAGGTMPQGQLVEGAWVFGISIGLMGLLGVGVGALTNEIFPSSSAANGAGAGLFAVFYVIRMIGDLYSTADPAARTLDSHWAVWVSPIGWAERMDPWGANAWGLAIPVIVLAAVLVVIAWFIQVRRDLDASWVRSGVGSPRASTFIRRPWGMGVRLQWVWLIVWTLGVVLFGFIIGSVIPTMKTMLEQSTMGGLGTLTMTVDGLTRMLMLPMLALIVGIFTAWSSTMLRADEAHGVLESQLAGSVGRVSWALQRLAVTWVMTVILLLLVGACLGLSYTGLDGATVGLGTVLGTALMYLPACLFLSSVFVLGMGLWPRAAVGVTWAVVGALWAIMIIGLALRIPQSVLNVMPFNVATPNSGGAMFWIPNTGSEWLPIIVLLAVAVVFTVVGLIGFRRRNIPV